VKFGKQKEKGLY